MHVALNAQLLSTQSSYRGAGVSHYCRHLLQALGQLATADGSPRFTAFVNAADFVAPGVELAVGPGLLARPPVRIAWEQLLLPRELRRRQVDLVHGLVNVLPLATSTPGVVTVHDLSFLRLPRKFPRAKRLYLTRLCQASVDRARHVIAVSRQTADDLVRFFGTAAARITVIHNGVDRVFSPGNPADIEAFRAGRGLPSRYFLYVGTLEPRKNLPTLIRAFARWRASGDPEAHQVKLVLAGAQGWFYAEIFRLVSELGLQDRVLFPGFVPDAELPLWYRAAEAFVYPSLFEGFGLPVLEAMACGTPVLCSRIGSLTEIVGEAALTVPPTAEDGWMAAMALLARQPQLRQELSRRGLAQAQKFSWEATALATLEVYQAVHGR